MRVFSSSRLEARRGFFVEKPSEKIDDLLVLELGAWSKQALEEIGVLTRARVSA